MATSGEIDALLRALPDQVVSTLGPYVKGPGYRCWKVGRRNWVQWNDVGPAARKQIPRADGKMRRWELFARFGGKPATPWEKPEKYALDWKWMPAGDDVWGCSHEALLAFPGSLADLKARLVADLNVAKEYSLATYGQ